MQGCQQHESRRPHTSAAAASCFTVAALLWQSLSCDILGGKPLITTWSTGPGCAIALVPRPVAARFRGDDTIFGRCTSGRRRPTPQLRWAKASLAMFSASPRRVPLRVWRCLSELLGEWEDREHVLVAAAINGRHPGALLHPLASGTCSQSSRS